MEMLKFDEVKKTWHQISRYQDSDNTPKFELEVHKKLLNIFQAGEFYYYIVDLTKVVMEFISPETKAVLGLTNEYDFSVEYIYENVHPDDREHFVANEMKVTEFFNALPPEKVMKYKVSYDYRLRKSDGSYIWVLMQTVTIQTDELGSVIRVLGMHTNVTHLKTENKPSGLSFIGLEGEPSFYNVPVQQTLLIPTKEIFTRREKEILRLIIQGITSTKISDILCISPHTVNSHRKNILKKSGCDTVTELISKTITKGWV
jgi:DNA-binding CsgD family transcriptional regulator